MTKLNIGIFGATGEVGQEIINVLDNFKFPIDKLFLYAGKSAGKSLKTSLGEIIVQKADIADYSCLDLAFWAISEDWSKVNWEKTKDSGCYVIDNSSAFRYDNNIPLIIPEINGDLLQEHNSRLIANPNCTTAIAAIPLHILNQIVGIKRIIFSTYQSASGAGNGGRRELLEQSRNYLNGKTVEHSKFQHPLPYNVIPHIDTFQENGYTKEEMKTDWETRKILRLDDSVRISSSCVRVPVERSHAEDITVETNKPVNIKEYRIALNKEAMLKVCDDPLNNSYPMPLNTSGN
ncbi:MAG TPA: aspartate-semialdehyde dehydrogenase, partial [Candidatus Paceibacterota bacterium]|nr:aspartate-semialdehyde dehydrogenase [Candidatus Paceibacterota bacterium]